MVSDPRSGIHGPDSVAWQLNRDVMNFVGAGRAALLQLAHPYVAHGVDQHSKTRTDARGRFQRTFDNVFAMTFGDLDDAFRAARRVHGVHNRIHGAIDEDVGRYRRGHQYRANDPHALMWVHATLVESVVCVRRFIGRPLPRRAIETYYQESKRFALLFGIPDHIVPPTWPAFREYFDRMVASAEIAVGRPGREIAEFLFHPPTPALGPLFAWYRVITAGLLPARLREPFGMQYGAAERLLFALSMPAIGAGAGLVPGPFRFLPGYIEALERVGRAPSSRYGSLADRLALGGMTLWPGRRMRRAA